MINEYKFSRKKLVELIKNNNKITHDGFYWYPNFILENVIPGNEKDYEYYYPREFFKYKMYFSTNDLEAYLALEKISDYNADGMYRKSFDFYDKNKDLCNIKNIKKKIPDVDFTIENLIDCYEYIYNNKF